MRYVNGARGFTCLTVFLMWVSLAQSAEAVSKSLLKDNQFLLEWSVLEAISFPEGQFNDVFEQEVATPAELWQSIDKGNVQWKEKKYQWKSIKSKHSIIDLDKLLTRSETVFTYAAIELQVAQAGHYILGVGSDDGVKVWVNDQLMHENLVFRGPGKDQDLVPVKLQQGSNRLLLKVINGKRTWGFAVRVLDDQRANSLFAQRSENMGLQQLEALIGAGVNINTKNDQGLTALHLAQLKGLNSRIQFFLEHGADKNVPLPDAKTFAKEYFNRGVDADSAGLSYLVVQNGEVLVKGGIGLADIEKQRPITTTTAFRIGSVTKQFAMVSIMQLQEQGKLSIEDPLAKYLPGFPRGDEVTLRQMLNHTSGIRTYTIGDEFWSQVAQSIKTEDLVKRIESFDYDFEPGTYWSYSNSGYFLLGVIIEKITGQPLDAYWHETLFEPLGMRNTGVYINGKTRLTDEALGYSKENGRVQRALDWDMSWAGAAGNLYSTVEDLLIWNQALHGGRVINAVSYTDATTPARLKNGDEVQAWGGSYGLGLAMHISNGRRVVAHGGGLNGFGTMLAAIPEERLTYITLSNSLPSNLRFNEDPLSLVASIVLGPPSLTEHVGVKRSESRTDWNDYVGQYDSEAKLTTVTLENGRLYAQHINRPRFEIFSSGGDAFYFKAIPAEMTFERDANNNVTGVIYNQNGHTSTAHRIETPVFIQLAPEDYDKFLGQYQLRLNKFVAITRENDRLFIQATGEERVEILPLSPLVFRGKEWNITLKFETMPDNKSLIAFFTGHEGGATFKASKIQ